MRGKAGGELATKKPPFILPPGRIPCKDTQHVNMEGPTVLKYLILAAVLLCLPLSAEAQCRNGICHLRAARIVAVPKQTVTHQVTTVTYHAKTVHRPRLFRGRLFPRVRRWRVFGCR